MKSSRKGSLILDCLARGVVAPALTHLGEDHTWNERKHRISRRSF
jgi:hypothetical protein